MKKVALLRKVVEAAATWPVKMKSPPGGLYQPQIPNALKAPKK